MTAGLARNWWVIGLRAFTAVGFTLVVVILPRMTIGALIIMFAVYVAADGFLALLASVRAMRSGEYWPTLILEGAMNLTLAGVVLVWPAMAAVAIMHLTSVWAMVTGALLLAGARRLSQGKERWVLATAGLLAAAWGVLTAVWGPTAESPLMTVRGWFAGYALPLAIVLMVLASILRRRHRRPSRPVEGTA
jgi:uncharacterized membrane protein HdeD (DUF308 family)